MIPVIGFHIFDSATTKISRSAAGISCSPMIQTCLFAHSAMVTFLDLLRVPAPTDTLMHRCLYSLFLFECIISPFSFLSTFLCVIYDESVFIVKNENRPKISGRKMDSFTFDHRFF